MSDNSPDEVLARLVAWLSDERGVDVDEGGTVSVAGDPPLELNLTADEERVVLTHERSEPGAGAARADQVIASVPDRGTSLHAAAAVDRDGVKVTLTNTVYVDGLSRQSFVAALNELVAAADSLGQADSLPTEEESVKPVAAETRIHEPIKAVVEEAPIEDGQPVPAESGFAPTHIVPAGGMRAWAEPDPSQQPASRLEAGVELKVTETRGDWAHGLGSNGWTGWVDARRLLSVGEAATTPASGLTVGGLEIRPLPLVAAVALLVSAFLPWVSQGGSTNSLDVPLSFLWDFTSSGDPQLGWIVIALGVLTLGVAVMKQEMRAVLMLFGVLSIALSAAFIVQMYRGIADFGGSGSDLFDWLGFAPWVALGAGVILLASSATPSKR